MRYKLGPELGSGSTAIVYLAEDTLLGRNVALKRLHLHLLNQAEAKTRFINEAKAVAGLAHENVVRLYDFLEDAGRFMLAFEYVEGGSLSDLLAKCEEPMPNLTVMALGVQLFSGLAAAHQNGIIHRDIKSSNILITSEGQVKLTDFGLAHLANGATLTGTGHLLGTPQFMSPEQADGLIVDEKSDIFSAGVVLYRCLSGKYPYQGRTTNETLMRAAKAQIEPLGIVQPLLIPGLGELVTQCLSKRATLRPTATEAKEHLKQIAENAGISLFPSRLGAFQKDPIGKTKAETTELEQLLREWKSREEAQGKKGAARKLQMVLEGLAASNTSHSRDPLPLKASRHRWVVVAFLVCLVFVSTMTVLLHFRVGWKKQNPTDLIGVPLRKEASIIDSLIMPVALQVSPAPEAEFIQANSADTPITSHIQKKDPPLPKIRNSGGTPNPMPETLSLASEIEAKQKPDLVEVAEQHEFAELRILTSPPFAEITIDNELKGLTPTRPYLTMPAGQHSINLKKTGFRPVDTNLVVHGKDTLELRFRLIAETIP